MKKLRPIILSYTAPLMILGLLLFTNLFTRIELIRKMLFPQRTIHISAQYVDDMANRDVSKFDIATRADDSACKDPLYDQGYAAYTMGQYSQASEVWRRLLDKNNCNRSKILNSIGLAKLRNHFYADAESYFTDAIKSDSLNDRPWYNRGIGYLRRNRLLDAQINFLRATEINSGFCSAHFNLGVLSLKLKKYRDAGAQFSLALECGSDKVLCWYNIGRALFLQDSLVSSLAAFNECIRYQPSNINARLAIAEIWLSRNMNDSAVEYLEDATRIDPANIEAKLRLARIWADNKLFNKSLVCLNEIDKIKAGGSESLYERARVYGLQGDDKRAILLYQRILAQDPDNPRVYYNIGVNLMDIGKSTDAIAAYSRALKADPSYWKAAYNIGVHFLKIDKPIEALPYFERVVQNVPDRSEPHYNLGLAYMKAGDFVKSIREFSSVAKLDSSNIDARYNLALAYMQDGRSDSAVVVFRAVLRLDSCHAKSYFNLGLIYKRQDSLNIAIKLLQRAILCRKGKYPSALYNLALCQRQMGEFSAALTTAKQSAILDDSVVVSVKTWLLIAGLYDTLGIRDSVETYLSKADALANNDPDALKQLSVFYNKRNNIGKIRSIYRRLLLKKPADAALLFTVAEFEATYGSTDSADVYFRRSLSVDDNSVDATSKYGTFLLQQKRFSEAAQYLQKSINLEPGTFEPRVQLAIVYLSVKKEAEAIREIDKTRKIITYSRDLNTAGKALYNYDFFSQAKIFFDLAVRNMPDDVDARYYQALCQARIENNVAADKIWQAFVSSFPNDSRGFLKLGRWYFGKKDYQKAKVFLEKSLSLREDDNARFYSAKSCFFLGDNAAARKHIDKYLMTNPNDKKGKLLYEEILGKTNR